MTSIVKATKQILSRCRFFWCLYLYLFFLSQPFAGLAQAGVDPVAALANFLQRGDCPSSIVLAKQILTRYPYGTVEAAQANLALGSCYLRAKRWSAAQRVLRLARPLPGRTAQTRRRLEEFAAERERDESRSMGTATTNSSWHPVAAQPYWQPPAPIIMPPLEPSNGKGKQRPLQRPSPAPVKAPKPPGPSTSFSITPALSYFRTYTSSDYSGLKQGNGSAGKSVSKITAQGRSETPMAYAGGDMLALSLPIELDYTQEASHGDAVSFVRADEAATTVAGTVTSSGAATNNFNTTATPALTLPLSSSIELKGAYRFSLTLPDFMDANKKSSHKPSASLDAEAGGWKVSAGVSYEERFGSSAESTESSTALNGSVSYGAGVQTWTLALARTNTEVPLNLRIAGNTAANTNASLTGKFGSDSGDFKLVGTYNAYDRFDGILISIPATAMELLGAVDVPFGVFTLGGSFSWASQSDFEQSFKIKDDSGTEVENKTSAEGSQIKFGGNFKVIAVKWLAIGISYSYQSTDYTITNPVVQKNFLIKNADLITTTVFSASIFREF